MIALLYGPKLAAAGASLHVLAWALVPMALATTLAQMLFAVDKQAIDLRVNVIATLVSVAGGAVLIPRWGAVGAAAAVLVSTSLYAGLQYVFVCQAVTDVSALGQLGKLLAIAAISLVVMLLVPGTNLLLTATVGLAAYAAGLAIAGVITRRDLDRVRLSLASATTVFR